MRGITPVEMYIRIIGEGDAAKTEAGVIGQSMTEPDIKAFYQQPWVMVASDGGLGSDHPRGAGTFPRVLGVFVREKHWLTLAASHSENDIAPGAAARLERSRHTS